MNKNKKETYEKPIADVIEFELKDSIAYSGDLGPNLACSDSVFE